MCPLPPQCWATRILKHWDHCNTQSTLGKCFKIFDEDCSCPWVSEDALRTMGEISYIPWCIALYYFIKLPNARDPISSTETWQLNNGGERLVLPIRLSVPLLCRSVYDFRFTIPNISLVKSKRVFWPPIVSQQATRGGGGYSHTLPIRVCTNVQRWPQDPYFPFSSLVPHFSEVWKCGKVWQSKVWYCRTFPTGTNPL